MGVVSCFYRGVTEKNIWSEMEALGAATDFFAGVLVADWMEGVTFALGASVATTKTWLAKIGGYDALANVLADDYELGNRVAKAGGRVNISREVVETMYPALTFAKFWEHQVRWARTVRLCRPVSYLGLIFTQGLPLAIIGAIASRSGRGAALFLCAYATLRLAAACTVGIWGVRDETARRKWWLLPLRDLLQFAVYVGSFFSNRIVWGEQEFRLSASGEMAPISTGDAKTGAGKRMRIG
jgi:ceramide glucosyltransferase